VKLLSRISYRREVLEAEKILVEEAGKFIGWQQSLGTIPAIARLQEKAEEYRQSELKKAAKKLQGLDPKELEVVDRLSKGICYCSSL
jgi:glutamyl-tRNA reductase